VEEHHKTHDVKLKYLKTSDPDTNQMFAYPEGLPQLDKIEKIHFVGHSMGAMAARYLQYLLKTGYFDELHGIPIQDRSGLIASITCISGANNGSNCVENIGMEYKPNLKDWVVGDKSKMMAALKLWVVG
jgi:triacylglycerol esterase/lipase EstA (alpha/beta hydrolase family)